jgi:DNA polymerase-3 subunit chi
MSQVEFIKLEKPEKAHHCCLLAEMCLNQGRRVMILVKDEDQGKTLDRFMWTWRKTSFIPHALLDEEEEGAEEPVLISADINRDYEATVLIMTTPCPVEFMRHFEHIYDFAEIFDRALHKEARKRFALYREEGLEPRMRQ